jgi:hypothetical protein
MQETFAEEKQGEIVARLGKSPKKLLGQFAQETGLFA